MYATVTSQSIEQLRVLLAQPDEARKALEALAALGPAHSFSLYLGKLFQGTWGPACLVVWGDCRPRALFVCFGVSRQLVPPCVPGSRIQLVVCAVPPHLASAAQMLRSSRWRPASGMQGATQRAFCQRVRCSSQVRVLGVASSDGEPTNGLFCTPNRMCNGPVNLSVLLPGNIRFKGVELAFSVSSCRAWHQYLRPWHPRSHIYTHAHNGAVQIKSLSYDLASQTIDMLLGGTLTGKDACDAIGTVSISVCLSVCRLFGCVFISVCLLSLLWSRRPPALFLAF
jgi:hypothetical protein